MPLFDIPEDKYTDATYSRSTSIPHYELRGEMPHITELVDKEKTIELFQHINRAYADGKITEEEKKFLDYGAMRHLVFNYSKIAEYYAGSNADMQSLMEESALVIIDIDNAIANGYVRLSKKLEAIVEDSKPSKSGD